MLQIHTPSQNENPGEKAPNAPDGEKSALEFVNIAMVCDRFLL
jgi:hypothetical protein